MILQPDKAKENTSLRKNGVAKLLLKGQLNEVFVAVWQRFSRLLHSLRSFTMTLLVYLFATSKKSQLIQSAGVLSLMFLSTGCGVYSFTGASISPEVQSVTINTFENRSQNGSVELSQLMTNELKDKFIRETDLRLIDYGGDIEFTGTIVSYSLTGQAPTGDQTTAAQRLTIGISVEYINNKEDGKDYKTTFSRFAEFDEGQSLESVKDELYDEIFEQLAIEVFNKALVNW